MYLVRFAILLTTVVAACGCVQSPRSTVHAASFYDSGKPKEAVSTYYEGKLLQQSDRSEYFESGRLKLEEWSGSRNPLVRLAFHENGRLKSEERFFNGQLAYGVYYSEAGEVERTVGQRLISPAQKKLPNN
jgi:hypothetical protein